MCKRQEVEARCSRCDWITPCPPRVFLEHKRECPGWYQGVIEELHIITLDPCPSCIRKEIEQRARKEEQSVKEMEPTNKEEKSFKLSLWKPNRLLQIKEGE